MKERITRWVKAFTNIMVGLLGGFLPDPDPEGLKAERVQFWIGLLKAGWKVRGGNEALERIVRCANADHANQLAGEMLDRCAGYGYDAQVLVAEGNQVVVRLTDPVIGQVTERDFGAAMLIDSCTD